MTSPRLRQQGLLVPTRKMRAMDLSMVMQATALNQDMKTRHTVTRLVLPCRSRAVRRNLDQCARRLQADDLHMDTTTGAATLALDRHPKNDRELVSEPARSSP